MSNKHFHNHHGTTFRCGMLPKEDWVRRASYGPVFESLIPNGRRWFYSPVAVKEVKRLHTRKTRHYMNRDAVRQGITDWMDE